jgi:hypothetical protein
VAAHCKAHSIFEFPEGGGIEPDQVNPVPKTVYKTVAPAKMRAAFRAIKKNPCPVRIIQWLPGTAILTMVVL